MIQRIVKLERTTKETNISLTLNLDGEGVCRVKNPIGFFDHMLKSFCAHGLFDLSGSLEGDLEVDQHHLIEDTGIVLGSLFDKALGDKAGIARSGFFVFAMDEALLRAAVDFGGRGVFVCNSGLGNELLGAFQTDCFEDFWSAFATNAKCALHLDTLRGRSPHHIMEGLFKAAAKAMREAVALDPRRGVNIPSTKGVIA